MIASHQKSKYYLPAIRTLMDQFDHPCILWDQENDKIIQINNQWEVLTNINLDDLNNHKIDDVLPGFKQRDQSRNEVITIKNKDGSLLKFQNICIPIDGGNELFLLMFSPVFSSVFNARKKPEILNDCITRLIELDTTKGLFFLAESTNLILNELLDSHFSAIYLNRDVSFTNLNLLSFAGEKDLFPKILDSNEINNHQNVETWKNGERTLNSLQRIAKQKGVSAITTASFEMDEGYQCLLLLAFKNRNISENDLFIIPIIKVIIQNIFKKASLYLQLNKNKTNQIFENEQLKELLNNASIGVVIVDNDKKILFSNVYFEELFGFEKWELLGQSLSEIIPNFDEGFPQTFQVQNSGILSKRFRKRDGNIFHARFLTQKIHSVASHDQSYQAIFIEDLSEVNRLRNEVVQLSRQAEMGVLVASFAHDVRNVFNSIKLNAESVQLIALGNLDVKEKMISIKDDCDEVNQLMESVLSFSTSFEKNQKQIDLHFMLERVIERWKPKLDKAKIHTVLQSDESPQIMGDARSLEQAFNNLISNARDAMLENGGTLGIHVSRPEMTDSNQTIKVSFSDTGVGIPEEDIQKIFDPFYSAKSGGTGLGLAITKKIIEYHSGTLHVNSFPGGTTFLVTLPISNTGDTK
jgi:two-component system, NtrC family, sensor histidine kinase AtoS